MSEAVAWLALRAATQPAHAVLEAVPLNRRLFADDFSAAELADLLSRMASIYRPLEARLAACEPALTLDYRRRLPLLLDGLSALGVAPPPAEAPIPLLEGEASCWGALYVVEGSTMGGQMIHRQLAARHPAAALGFFLPHGDQAGENWRRFRTRLEVALGRPEALDQAIAAAIATFQLFDRALSA
ncbi:MAG: biliverdin-producing heme oxygenase [Rhodospirillaceae bacterium]